MKTNNLDNYTSEQDSIPRAATGTGTITSVNNHRKIVGTGTLFTKEANINDWIYIKPQNAFRKIINILNDLELTIENPFGVNLSTSAFFITPASRFISVSYAVTVGTPDVDGVTLPVGFSNTLEKGKNWKNAAGNFVDPIDVDTTGGGVVVVSVEN